MIPARTDAPAIAMLLAAVMFASAGHAAGLDTSALRAAIDPVFADIDGSRMPGCAVGVIHRGEYVLKAGYGLANLEYDLPITSQTIFRTGSLSKQFTAMAIALLAQRGAIDLDADVHTYLPDLRDYGATVTIRQMIHHVAGMGDYGDGGKLFTKPDGTEFRFGNEDYWTTAEFYQAVRNAPLTHPPGARWEYSNLAYFLLSQVVERVTGRTLRQFAETEMFAPLSMGDTLFYDNVNEPVKNRADGYRKTEDGSYELYMTNLAWVGDGGIYTNLDDFIRWDRNWTDNRLGDGRTDLITQAIAPVAGFPAEDKLFGDAAGYGFGLFIAELHDQPVIGHTGSWVGFSSLYLRFPDLSLSIVTFCNSTDAKAQKLGDAVATIAIGVVSGGQ